MRRASIVVSLVIALLAVPGTAGARKSHEYAYRYEQVWGAAIRLIRVDCGFEIRDRDEEIGFLLFDYREGQNTYPGSLELVRTVQDGQEKVRVVMQIPTMPSYIEQMLIDRLGRKLQADFGEPLRPTRRAPPEAPPEAPAEGADPAPDSGEAASR